MDFKCAFSKYQPTKDSPGVVSSRKRDILENRDITIGKRDRNAWELQSDALIC